MGGRSPGHGPARASQLRWRLQAWAAWTSGMAVAATEAPRPAAHASGAGLCSLLPWSASPFPALHRRVRVRAAVLGGAAARIDNNANQSHSASAMALPRQYGADQGSMAMPSRRHTGPARTAPSTALGKPYGSTGTYAMDAPGIGPDAVHVTGPQPPGREQRAGAHRAQRIGGGQRGQRRQQRRQDEDAQADGEPAQVLAMAAEPRHGLEGDHHRDREDAGKPRAGSSDTHGSAARNETPGRSRVFRWLPTWPCPGRRPPRRRGPPLPDRPDSGARPPSARRPARTAAGCRWGC